MKVKFLFLLMFLFLVGCNNQTTVDTTETNQPTTSESENLEVEFRVSEGMLQWKYESDVSWNDIYSLDNLSGTGIISAVINAEGELIITYSDDSIDNLGKFNDLHLVQFLDGEGRVLSVQLVRDGEAATEPTTPSLVGHYFAGWDKEFDEILEDLVITPYFFYEFYTAYLNENGGSEVGNYGTDYGIPVELPVPERPGYLFLGWYYGLEIQSPRFENRTVLTSDVTLYAHWQKTNSINVSSEEEFLEALADSSIEQIFFTNDIEITERINITRPITIIGNGYNLVSKITEDLFYVIPENIYSSADYLYPNNSHLKIFDLDIIIDHEIDGYYASNVFHIYDTKNFELYLENVDIIGEVHKAIYINYCDGFKLTYKNGVIDNRQSALYSENSNYFNYRFEGAVLSSNYPIYIMDTDTSFLSIENTEIINKEYLSRNMGILIETSGSNDFNLTNVKFSSLNDEFGTVAIWVNDFFGGQKIRLDTVEIETSSNSYSNVINDEYDNNMFSGREVKVIIKEGVTTIPDEAFRLNSIFSQIVLPSTLTSVGNYAFNECNNLQSVVIPFGVISIGDNAFSGNELLTSVYLPQSVTYVGNEAFSGAKTELVLYVEEGIDMSSWVMGWDTGVLNKEMDAQGINIVEGLVYVGLSNDEAHLINYLFSDQSIINIPHMVEIGGVVMEVKEIAPYAFYNNYTLIGITIPETIREIGVAAFSENRTLENVTFASDGVLRKISAKAFSNCTSLKSINLPDSLEYLETLAFAYNSNLESVDFGENPQIQSIEDYVFSFDEDLKEITIPDSVTVIKTGAFQSCIRLKNVYFSENSQLNEISDYAFYYSLTLVNFDLPDGVTLIDDYAFYHAFNMLEFNISNESNLDTIGVYAFGNNVKITEINLPSSVSYIGDGAFYNCDGLLAVYLPEALTLISPALFYDCDNIQLVQFSEYSTISSISDNAFEDMDSLMYINLPDTVTIIGYRAFSNAKSLEVITLPASLSVIEDYAFDGAINLVEVVYSNMSTLTSIGLGAFSNCFNLIEFFIPESVVTLGEGVFMNDTFLMIYVEAETQPVGWDPSWNMLGGIVTWGYVM